MCEGDPYSVVTDAVEYTQVSAHAHKLFRREITEKTLPERGSLRERERERERERWMNWEINMVRQQVMKMHTSVYQNL